MESVDARDGVTTGISAADRARTIRMLIDPKSRPQDLVRPGHLFPLEAVEGGVLQRNGHTEAAVDLAKMAGLTPAGVICEILRPDGGMARLPELRRFARRHRLPIISVAMIAEHRRRTEDLVRLEENIRFPTQLGMFRLKMFASLIDGKNHLALVMGDVRGGESPLARVHSECLTGDAFGSLRCDCGSQLHRAMAMIAGEGRGVLLYLRQEGRGIGLESKIRAYALQEKGYDTVEANEQLGFEADERDYSVAANMLRHLGVGAVRLITNNPRKISGLTQYGIRVASRVPLVAPPTPHNAKYLATKAKKMGHWL
jgi:3,4-dihydroxy 2-butanone 4-phosphate synthase/GTP cyclohydrolase II